MARETAILGGGCFWCLEAVFQEVKGVESVLSGYAGGHVENPSYEAVSKGATGHAEVVRVLFDPDVISYADVLRVFFMMHDPTKPDRQGNDIGPQYRSVIFFQGPEQERVAREVMEEAADRLPFPVVTQLEELTAFYPAEDYHQNFFENHPEQGYCNLVIAPKVVLFRRLFPHWLKA